MDDKQDGKTKKVRLISLSFIFLFFFSLFFISGYSTDSDQEITKPEISSFFSDTITKVDGNESENVYMFDMDDYSVKRLGSSEKYKVEVNVERTEFGNKIVDYDNSSDDVNTYFSDYRYNDSKIDNESQVQELKDQMNNIKLSIIKGKDNVEKVKNVPSGLAKSPQKQDHKMKYVIDVYDLSTVHLKLGNNSLNLVTTNTLDNHGDSVNAIDYADDKRKLAVGTDDGYVFVYDTNDYSDYGSYQVSSESIETIFYDGNRDYVFVGAGDYWYYLDASDKDSISESGDFNVDDTVTGISATTSSGLDRYVVVSTEATNTDDSIYEYDYGTTSGYSLQNSFDEGFVDDVSFNRNSGGYEYAYIDPSEPYLKILDVDAEQSVSTESISVDTLDNSIDFSNDEIAISDYQNEEVKHYSFDGSSTSLENTFSDMTNYVQDVSIDNFEHNHVLTGDGDGNMYIYDFETGSLEDEIQPTSSGVRAVSIDWGVSELFQGASGHSNSNAYTYQEELEGVDVETNQADNIGDTEADLNGEITDLGDYDDALVYFEYRESGGSWSDITDSEETLSSTGSFDYTLSGLDEDTSYEFRAIAEYGDDIYNEGSVESFTTTGGEPSEPADNLTEELISYYELEETSGDVIDSHGDNDGTNNGATRGVTGKINNAFEFDGSDDYVDVGNIIGSGQDELTISLWFKADSSNDLERMFSRWGDYKDSFNLYINNGKVGFELKTEGGGYAMSGSESSYNTGEWIHAVGVYDGDEMKLYLDG
ncbi:MAG: LamG-like jellyroll fold domain-containing protein, partial [Promethearchaeota archaeon]